MSLRTAVGAALSRNLTLDCRFAVALADNSSYYYEGEALTSINSMQPPALRSAADAGRQASKGETNEINQE